MKLSILIYTLFMTFSCASNEFTLLHYNIRELDSKKIGEQDLQIKKTAQILRNFQFDIFSLNEIQYDLPGVPNRNYSSKGENLDKLKGLLGVPASWSSSFYPANTGMNAQKNGRGEYETDPAAPGARDLADPVNFGTLPGQYSTGAIYKFPKTKETVFNKIKWKEFNPNIDLDQFALPSGEPLPENIELFDKNFSDIELNINGETVHLVLLHTVPSFHFGNLKSPNYARNRDQLRFLEWYLTGKTDIKPGLSYVEPIAGQSYIAVGDFNADLRDEKNPGGKILKSLFKKANLWMNEKELSFTNEASSYEPEPFRLMLDYIVTSPNIVALNAKIIHPSFERVELGCGDKARDQIKEGMVLKTYLKDDASCNVLVSQEYEQFKEASDHYPLWGRFQIK